MGIRARFVIVAVVGLVLSVLVVGGIALAVFWRLGEERQATDAAEAKDDFTTIVAKQAEMNEAIAAVLARSPTVQGYFRNDDRVGAVAGLADTFKTLRSFGIANLHLHRPSTVTLARLHAPQQFDDDLTNLRHLIVEVNADRRPRRGPELGLNGLPIRGAVPVIDPEGTHLGVIEVGSFIDRGFLQTIAGSRKQYAVYYLAAGKPVMIAASQDGLGSILSESQLIAAADGNGTVVRLDQGGRHLLVTAMPFRDYADRVVGVVQIGIDTTSTASAVEWLLMMFLAAVALILVFGGAAAIVTSNSISRPLDDLVKATNGVAGGLVETSIPHQHRADLIGRFARAVESFRVSRNELIAAKIAAETANSAKRSFLSAMSHELRTPLNAIMGFSEFLLATAKSGKPYAAREAAYIEDILSSGRDLLRLVDGVLTITQADSGRMAFTPEAFDLAAAADEIVRAYEASASAAGVHIQADLPGKLSVFGDEQALRRAIINLLSNALKYTPKNGVVSIEVRRDIDDVVLTVSDTGPGIAAEERDSVFRPFHLVSDREAWTTAGSGLGLGLPIARAVIVGHGGRLSLGERAGGGTVVIARWPVDGAFEELRATG